MARLGPTIPIYIDIDTSAKAALQKWTKYNQEFQKITAKYESQFQAAGMKKSQSTALFRQLAAYKTNIQGAAGSAARLRAEVQKLTIKLNNTKPDTKRWESYKQKLEETRLKLAQVEQKIRSVGTGSSSSVSGVNALTGSLATQSTYLGRLITRMALYWAVSKAAQMIRSVREVTAEFELQRVALGALLQNEAEATILFERLKKAAVESPFEVKDLVTYTKQLAAYQIEQDELYDTMMRLGDLSAGLGVDMNRLILAYGQVKSASVLRGQEMRQFTEAGIPLVQALADKFTELRGEAVSTAEVFDLVSKRAVSFEMVKSVIEDMTSVGGQFYEMQEKQAETLAGKWSNLKDSISIMYDEIGRTQGVNKAINGFINVTRNLAENWRQVWAVLKTAAAGLTAVAIASANARRATMALSLVEAKIQVATAGYTVKLTRLQTALLGKTRAEKLSTVATKVYSLATAKAAASTNIFSAAIWKLTAAMAKNPIGVFAVALSVLAGTFAILAAKAKDAKEEIASTTDHVVALQEALDKLLTDEDEGNQILEIYTKLSAKEQRSAREDARLKTVIELARARYGDDVVESIDKETGAIKLNIEALKEKIDTQKKANDETLTQQITDRTTELTTKTRELEEAKEKLAEMQAHPKHRKTEGGEVTDFGGYSKKAIRKQEALVAQLQDDVDQLEQGLLDVDDKLKESQDTGEETLIGWRKQLSEYEASFDSTKSKAFTEEEIQNFESQQEAMEETAKRYKQYKEEVDSLSKALAKEQTEEVKKSLEKDKGLAQSRMDLYSEILTKYNAWSLTKTETESKTVETDPFISQMRDQMKFMQDFKKGYDKLREYLSEEGAIDKELETMVSRGLALGIDKADQRRAAKDLSEWYTSAMDSAFEAAKAYGAQGNITSFLNEQISDASSNGKTLKKFQELIQSLWDAKTDLDVSEMVKNLEQTVERAKNELKRSETVRNFYNGLFSATGDKKLAANLSVSVYGDIGTDFKERIQEQLNAALASLEIKTPEMEAAIRTQDFGYLLDNIEQFPTAWQKVIRDMATDSEKYYADIAKSYADLLTRFADVSHQRVNIQNQAAKDIETIEQGLAAEIKGILASEAAPEEQARLVASAQARATAAKEAVQRQEELDLLKLSREYNIFFESVGVLSMEAARKVANSMKEIITAQFEAGEISLTKFRSELNRIDEQLEKYQTTKNPLATYLSEGIDGLTEKLQEYSDGLTAISGNLKNVDDNFSALSMDEDTKAYINKIGSLFGGSIFGVEGVKGRKNVFKDLKEALGDNTELWQKALDTASNKIEAKQQKMAVTLGWVEFWVQLAGGAVRAFDEIAEASKNSEGKVKKGWNTLAQTIFGSATLGIGSKKWKEDSWERLVQMNEEAMSGFEKLKKGDIVGALVDVVQSWTYVFGKNITGINRQIEEQEDILHNLERSYEKLETAMEDTFGSDYIYNYNEQLKNLQAQAEAYRKQAELEESKGSKNKDDDKIREYRESVEDAEAQIEEMSNQLSEFFTGTDITSAASDFANEWIEAYKSFSGTTSAMEEKFREMIQNMIVNSLAAKAMQSLLEPIFTAIDEASADGELDAQEIATIKNLTDEMIPQINDSMLNLMNQLGAAGLNVRQQYSGLTGISKDIANASEESILGLAAGINTQNFYIGQTNGYVYQILQILKSGGSSAVTTATAAAGASDNYLASLPTIANHTASILERCETMVRYCEDMATNINRVVHPKGSVGSYWIITN